MSTPLEGQGLHVADLGVATTPTTQPARALAPPISEAVTHLCLGRRHLTLRRDELAAHGYMLRDENGTALFGGTFAACMEEAAEVLHDHLARIGAAR